MDVLPILLAHKILFLFFSSFSVGIMRGRRKEEWMSLYDDVMLDTCTVQVREVTSSNLSNLSNWTCQNLFFSSLIHLMHSLMISTKRMSCIVLLHDDYGYNLSPNPYNYILHYGLSQFLSKK